MRMKSKKRLLLAAALIVAGDAVRAVVIDDENVHVQLVVSEDAQLRVDYAENQKHVYEIQQLDGTLSIHKVSNADMRLTGVASDRFVELKTVNGGVALERLSFGTTLRASTGNNAIRGTVVGQLGDFSYACHTANGACNLPEALQGGDKQIELTTVNGDIDISFVE